MDNYYPYNKINYKGLFIMLMIHLTFFFHPMIEAMLTVAAERPVPVGKFPTGRALDVVQFGLIYGMPFAFFDPVHILFGVCLFGQMLKKLPESLRNAIIDDRPYMKFLMAHGGYLFCFNEILNLPFDLLKAAALLKDDASWTIHNLALWHLLVLDKFKASLVICCFLVIGNIVALKVQGVGEDLARKMSQNALQMMQSPTRQAHGQGLQSYLGPISFITWGFLICTIMVI